MNIQYISREDKKFPKYLKNIKKCPIGIYAIGNINLLNEGGVAIIGSRNYSKYGEKYAKIFSEELAKQNITIISGMAKRNRQFCSSKSN